MSNAATLHHFIDPPVSSWLWQALKNLENQTASVLITIVSAKGSTPRGVGTQMLVTKDDIWKTIGGGALEFDLIAKARMMINNPDGLWQRQLVSIILGSDVGQCCGGVLQVLLEKFSGDEAESLAKLWAEFGLSSRALDSTESGVGGEATPILAHPLCSGSPLRIHQVNDSPLSEVFLAPITELRTPLFLYGAGHVSRALMPRLADLGFDIHLVDITEARFPPRLDTSIHKVLAGAPATIARHAPAQAVHIVMTHDHALDEAICLQILARGEFSFLGLIGSATKRARFTRRLRQAGISEAMLSLLVCPIGVSQITGKEPARVALSIAAQLAIWQQSGSLVGEKNGAL